MMRCSSSRTGCRGRWSLLSHLYIHTPYMRGHPSLPPAEADRRALRQCEDWLQGAVTFVMEVDAQLEALVFSDATLNVAAEWVALAQNTIAQVGCQRCVFCAWGWGWGGHAQPCHRVPVCKRTPVQCAVWASENQVSTTTTNPPLVNHHHHTRTSGPPLHLLCSCGTLRT